MLQCEALTVRFGGVVPLDCLDFTLPERGLFLLVGPNGAGKTTFMNVLTRVCDPAGGRVLIDGTNVLALRPHEVIGAGIGRSFQKAELFGAMTVMENVMVGLDRMLLPEREARKRAHEVLESFGLANKRDVRARDLPYGHQKMLDVARALVSGPRLLLLDEPLAGLTEREVPALLATVERLASERTVLMVEHHLDIVMNMAQRVTVIDFGRKIAEGPPAAVRTDPEVLRCYLGVPQTG
ncbi:MAG TPA: ABC transporter ATP-binding protein [Candidatus Acidoferrales bacterium]|nr:ABC transporter ATP-binding protein [Candidatus Acidoferrales bacterium]